MGPLTRKTENKQSSKNRANETDNSIDRRNEERDHEPGHEEQGSQGEETDIRGSNIMVSGVHRRTNRRTNTKIEIIASQASNKIDQREGETSH